MHCHPNAILTPRGRARVFEAVEAGMTVSAACLGAGVSRRCYYRWLPRWQADAQRRPGRASLAAPPQPAAALARSTRPDRRPCDSAPAGVPTAWGPPRAAGLDVPPGPAPLGPRGRAQRRARAGRALRARSMPGDLVHLDTKKLGRIVGGPGHRATGDRGERAAGGRLGGAPRGHRRCQPPRLR